MELLLHNPLAEMYGPTFLLFYLLVICVTIAGCAWALQGLDPTRSERPPLVPSHPDPYEIAYLRGGENEVTRVAVFALMQRGYLELINQTSGRVLKTSTQKIAQTPFAPDPALLTPLERDVYAFFALPRGPQDIFTSALPANVKLDCVTYEVALRAERLLTPEEYREAARKIGWTGAAIVAAFGGYKLWAALNNGYHNVGFLMLLSFITFVALAVLCRGRRVSRRGKVYLESLKQAFGRFKRPIPNGVTYAMAYDPLVLAVGVFGVTALAGTPQAAYAQMFAQSASSSGGCGSGCGSGDGGSGGCGSGGGCGGCGGGG